MSYCRFGADSDVYVIATDGLECFCEYSGTGSGGAEYFVCKTKQEMLAHLEEHIKDGDVVPDHAIARLKEEIKEEEWDGGDEDSDLDQEDFGGE